MYVYIYMHIRSSSSKYLNISIQSAINTIVRAYRAAAEREISIGTYSTCKSFYVYVYVHAKYSSHQSSCYEDNY